MKLVVAGLLIIGVAGVVLGTSAVIYLMVNSFDISTAFWMSAGLIVAVCSLTPFRRMYTQLTKLRTAQSQRLNIIAEDEEPREVLTKLAALLLFLALLAWAIER